MFGPNKTKYINLRVFNIIIRTNESKVNHPKDNLEIIFGDETLEYKKVNNSLSKIFYYLLYLLILLPVIIIVAYWHVQKYLAH